MSEELVAKGTANLRPRSLGLSAGAQDDASVCGFFDKGWPKNHTLAEEDRQGELIEMPIEVVVRWPQWWLKAVDDADRKLAKLWAEKDDHSPPSTLSNKEADKWWDALYECHRWFEREEHIMKELQTLLNERLWPYHQVVFNVLED
jgi:hypothetical protein